MVAAISPISGFLNIAPVIPISLPGMIGATQLLPVGGTLLPDVSAIVSLAGAAGTTPLTYTATGSFQTTLQITPTTTPTTPTTPGTTPLLQHVHLHFGTDLDLLIVRDRTTAGTPLSSLPPDTIKTLMDAITTDLLLTSFGGSSGGAGNLASQLLTGLFGGLGSPFGNNPFGNNNTLFGNTLFNPLTGTTATTTTTSIAATVNTNLTLTVNATPATTATATTPVTVATAPTAVTAAVPTAATPTPTTAAPTITANALAAPVALTAAPTAVTPAAAAAANTTLQRFLTDAAARALDTIANNPSYAAAAALYASVLVFRNQAEALTALPVPGGDNAVAATAAVRPLPTSVA